MKRYTFPAVFTSEDDGGYSVSFPDLEGCYTCGDDYDDAMRMAKDVLSFTLYDYEKSGKPIPRPTTANATPGGFIRLISCDTSGYAHRQKAAYVENRPASY